MPTVTRECGHKTPLRYEPRPVIRRSMEASLCYQCAEAEINDEMRELDGELLTEEILEWEQAWQS